jgi:hydroxymethylbilane synthase
VRDLLAKAGTPGELVIIKTSGDSIQDQPLQAMGGKGLFVKEIEEALLKGDIDIAVHSLKDMPAQIPMGLSISSVPQREDPRDVLIPRDPNVRALNQLPRGAVVATGSLRRKAQLLRVRPDLNIVGIRGNIDTRLKKVREGEGGIDATILAAAGIARLSMDVPEAIVLDTALMLPAVGQGALAIESSLDAFELEGALLSIDHAPSATCVAAERAYLERLEGSCTVPLAGYAVIEGNEVVLKGLVCGESGAPWYYREIRGPQAYARRLGGALAEQLLEMGAESVLEAAR